MLSRMLGDDPRRRAGRRGAGRGARGRAARSLDVPVAALVDDSMGLQAYMEIGALHRLLREGGTVSGAALTVDPAALDALLRAR